MPTPTYDLLASNVLSSSASSVTFSSIPATYRDLVFVAQYSTSSGNYSYLRFNGDSGFNYPSVLMMGDGSSATSATISSSGFVDVDFSTSTGGLWKISVFDYQQTDKHKTVLYSYDVASLATRRYAGRWANTSAVTSATFVAGASNFLSGSTFYLYGIVS